MEGLKKQGIKSPSLQGDGDLRGKEKILKNIITFVLQ